MPSGSCRIAAEAPELIGCRQKGLLCQVWILLQRFLQRRKVFGVWGVKGFGWFWFLSNCSCCSCGCCSSCFVVVYVNDLTFSMNQPIIIQWYDLAPHAPPSRATFPPDTPPVGRPQKSFDWLADQRIPWNVQRRTKGAWCHKRV